jgi:D-beta-D-heptose 7-phosphate kinase/D-beta-D-heptose 1-phosphate adenosyltransferase
MIVAHNELNTVRAGAGDKSIALRLGCYDLLHIGHLEGIRFAGEQADLLVVGVASDDRVRQFKGSDRPIQTEERRLAAVDEVPGVDYSFRMPTGRLALGQAWWGLHPDVFVEGNEHPGDRLQMALLAFMGIDYVMDEGPKIESTTSIIERFSFKPEYLGHD